MLAFTMQFSKHERTPTHTPTNHQNPTTTGFDVVWEQDQSRTQKPHPPTRRTGKFQRPEDNKHQKTSDARSLRTQQCAQPHQPDPRTVFLNPPLRRETDSTHVPDKPVRLNSQCSTNERTHPRDVRSWHEPWTPPPPEQVSVWPVCSLERR